MLYEAVLEIIQRERADRKELPLPVAEVQQEFCEVVRVPALYDLDLEHGATFVRVTPTGCMVVSDDGKQYNGSVKGCLEWYFGDWMDK